MKNVLRHQKNSVVKSRQKIFDFFFDFGTGKYLGRVNILNLDKNDYFICSSQMVKVIIILEEVDLAS